jgi:hypothetical protein
MIEKTNDTPSGVIRLTVKERTLPLTLKIELAIWVNPFGQLEKSMKQRGSSLKKL